MSATTVSDTESPPPTEPPVEPPVEPPELSPEAAGPVDRALLLEAEALMFAADRALSAGRLAEWLTREDRPVMPPQVHEAVRQLNAEYEQADRSFRVEQVAGGYRVMTLPKYGALVHRAGKAGKQDRLNPAALETLAIVAYKQPIIRQEIENIRGVASSEVIRGLLDRKLIKVVGRAEDIGRPMLYGTTKLFLEAFGLSSLKDLPKARELKL